MNGKRFIGPCMHPWGHVLAQFAMCAVKGCDGKAACPKCGSRRTAPFHGVPGVTVHCWTCGAVW